MIKYIFLAAIIISCHSRSGVVDYKMVYHPYDTLYVKNGENSFDSDTSIYKDALQKVIDSFTDKGFDGCCETCVSPKTQGYAYAIAKQFGFSMEEMPISNRKIKHGIRFTLGGGATDSAKYLNGPIKAGRMWDFLPNEHNKNPLETDASGHFEMGRGPLDTGLDTCIGNVYYSEGGVGGGERLHVDETKFTDSFYVSFEGISEPDDVKLSKKDYEVLGSIFGDEWNPILHPIWLPKGTHIHPNAGINPKVNE